MSSSLSTAFYVHTNFSNLTNENGLPLPIPGHPFSTVSMATALAFPWCSPLSRANPHHFKSFSPFCLNSLKTPKILPATLHCSQSSHKPSTYSNFLKPNPFSQWRPQKINLVKKMFVAKSTTSDSPSTSVGQTVSNLTVFRMSLSIFFTLIN